MVPTSLRGGWVGKVGAPRPSELGGYKSFGFGATLRVASNGASPGRNLYGQFFMLGPATGRRMQKKTPPKRG
jgi:hypothetical protein